MHRRLRNATGLGFLALLLTGMATLTTRATAAEAEDATPRAYIVNLADGQHVTSPFKVIFGLSHFGVAPAGVERPKTGHHHLLIDTRLSESEYKAPIPSDAQHRHFGGGQTEVVLDLPPGPHTLQLVLGDANHVPFDPSIESEVIHIHVDADKPAP
ncbi:MAG: DUF4399 domain-containing protein [Rhodothalassiaceae bacterium]